MKYVEELNSFLELMDDHELPSYFTEQFLDFKQENLNVGAKKVGIIGDPFYSIYAKAYGLHPIIINGGSYFSGENTDMFPQISDPVAKSAMGMLLDPEYNLSEELDAVLVVAVNDSYKKTIAYLKEININVIQVEPIPYIREGKPFALYKQQLMALNDLSKLVFGVFQEGVFKNELHAFDRAYDIMQEDSFKALPTIYQSFLTHILHNVFNKNEWCDEMEEYLEGRETNITEPLVTIMGSGMYLPNHKLFKICHDIGIKYFDNECMYLPDYSEMDISGGALSLLGKCFAFQHKNAYNSATVGNVERVVLPTHTSGIIYYLLKGQVSEAYHSERMEELAIEQGVPFICVETDYTYTDIEQLKIRVEAFYEMLSASARQKKSISS